MVNRKKLYTMLGACSLALAGLACNNNASGPAAPVPRTAAQTRQTAAKDGPGTDSLNTAHWSKADGVLALRPGYHDEAISIFNENGKVWKTSSFTDEFRSDSIRPFAIKPESILLVFRCVAISDDGFNVIVGEDKQLHKLIRRSDTNFVYETWPEHIVKLFSVGFDVSSNPIRKDTSENSKTLGFSKDAFYHPVKCIGKWLLIKDDNNRSGWIKWKNEKGELIITPYYEA